MILLDSEHFRDGDGGTHLSLKVKSGLSAAEGHLWLIKFSPKSPKSPGDFCLKY